VTRALLNHVKNAFVRVIVTLIACRYGLKTREKLNYINIFQQLKKQAQR